MTEPGHERTLAGRRLLLGVSGGIAAYKTPELVRLFKKQGTEVQVVMTPNAVRFVTPLTLGTVSEREVLTDIFPEQATGSWTRHVELGLWADLFVVAPATAETIAKLANGFCDSMLTAVALAARCPVLVCPSMDRDMYGHPAVRRNLERLREFGSEVLEAAYGELASGLVGIGRMPEPERILAAVVQKLDGQGRSTALQGKRVLVTAGPTHEALDPVRFLTNHSTGTMGFALAAAAARRGATVTLVSGPTGLDTPGGVERVDVTTAQEMHDAVQRYAASDLILMAAAVADYAPAEFSQSKIKKGEGDLVLHLRRTPDILAGLGRSRHPGQVIVGFALETGEGLPKAQGKLKAKNLDWIVLNDLREAGAGFGAGTNRVTLIGRDGQVEDLPLMSKARVAEAILDRVTGEQPGP